MKSLRRWRVTGGSASAPNGGWSIPKERTVDEVQCCQEMAEDKTEINVLDLQILSMLSIIAKSVYICSTMECKLVIYHENTERAYGFLTTSWLPWALGFRGWKPAFTTNHHYLEKKIPMT